MLDFDIQRCTRRCLATDRELKAGDVVYSVLLPSGSRVVRQDYSEEGWPGAPENAIGWWKSTIAESGAKKMHWAPNEVLLHFFQQLTENATKEDVCYVLALLLVRRRVLRVEATEDAPDGRETLVVYCAANETEYRVTVNLPNEERIRVIQHELAHLLQTGAA